MTDDRREWFIYRDDERLPWREKYSTANRYDIVNNEVYCSKCCDWYDKDTFPLDKNNKHGLHLYCRNCKRADSDKYKKSRADSARRRRYGIAADEYDNLFTQQNGVCAICSQPETRVVKGVIASLAVDHDHNTGKIRGLLCSRCNIALGHVEAIYAGWFESAEKYLRGKALT